MRDWSRYLVESHKDRVGHMIVNHYGWYEHLVEIDRISPEGLVNGARRRNRAASLSRRSASTTHARRRKKEKQSCKFSLFIIISKHSRWIHGGVAKIISSWERNHKKNNGVPFGCFSGMLANDVYDTTRRVKRLVRWQRDVGPRRESNYSWRNYGRRRRRRHSRSIFIWSHSAGFFDRNNWTVAREKQFRAHIFLGSAAA